MARGVEVLLLLTQSTRRCGGCGFALKYVIAQRTGEEGEEEIIWTYIELFTLHQNNLLVFSHLCT